MGEREHAAAGSPDHDQRLKVLLEAYANLDEAQRLQALLTTEQYQEVRPIMITTYERGIIEGRQQMALL